MSTTPPPGEPRRGRADRLHAHPEPVRLTYRRASALARRALRFRQQTPHGERLAFEGGEQVERELRAAVAAEAAAARS
jgi:hypothetical protein